MICNPSVEKSHKISKAQTRRGSAKRQLQRKGQPGRDRPTACV